MAALEDVPVVRVPAPMLGSSVMVGQMGGLSRRFLVAVVVVVVLAALLPTAEFLQGTAALAQSGSNEIVLPTGGSVTVRAAKGTAVFTHDLTLVEPETLTICSSCGDVESTVWVGYLPAGTELEFEMEVWNTLGEFQGAYLSTDPTRAVVEQLGPDSWWVRWEDAGDGDFNDLLVSINDDSILGMARETLGLAADPVSTATGNFVHSVTDLVPPPNSGGLALERTYNALDGWGDGAFGVGWSASMIDVSLTTKEAEPPGSASPWDHTQVMVALGDGTRGTFVWDDGSSSWLAPEGIAASLTESAVSESYELEWLSGDVWLFDDGFDLVEIQHPNGQILVFDHDPGGSQNESGLAPGATEDQAVLVVSNSTTGWDLTFYDVTGDGLVDQVADSGGRRVTYAYDGAVATSGFTLDDTCGFQPGVEERLSGTPAPTVGELVGVSAPFVGTTDTAVATESYSWVKTGVKDAERLVSTVFDGVCRSVVTNSYDGEARVDKQWSASGGTTDFYFEDRVDSVDSVTKQVAFLGLSPYDGLWETIVIHNRVSQCFVAGTPVRLDDGTTVPIEDLGVGDAVAGGTVTETLEREAATLWVELSNGESLETTPEHPFRVADEWVAAGDLEAGMVLDTEATDAVLVVGVRATGRVESVYNLQVDGTDTYRVGDAGVLVHNKSPLTMMPPVGGDIIGSAPQEVFRYFHNDKGHLMEVHDSTGEPITKDYTAGRLSTFSGRTEDGQAAPVWSKQFDDEGRTTELRYPDPDNPGAPGAADYVAYWPDRAATTDPADPRPWIQISPDGVTTTIEYYDSQGGLSGETSDVASTKTWQCEQQDAEGGSDGVDGDDACPTSGAATETQLSGGLVTQISDPEGVVSSFGYNDPAVTVQMPADGHFDGSVTACGTHQLCTEQVAGVTTTYTYDRLTGQPASRTTPDGTTFYAYDVAGQLLESRDPLYDGVGHHATVYGYDDSGRIEWTSDVGNPDRDGPTGPDGYAPSTSMTYTILGDVDTETTLVCDPAGGDCGGATGPVTTATKHNYDDAGRLREVVAAHATTDAATTAYTFGPLGRLESVVDPAGITSWFCYDADGNRTDVVVDPNPVDCATLGVPDGTTQHTHTVFDLLGRATDTYDAAGVRATTSYDPAGRVVSETRAVGTGDETTTSYGYDPLGRRVTTSTEAGARDGQGAPEFSGVTERRSYSDAGRLEWVCIPPVDANPVNGFVMSTGCDTSGERKTTNTYDSSGRLGSVTATA
ncbi:MAG: hypothetical protein GY788_05260, partial [bacterium]|nr:hypothetical protein [bacterium]